ncbi:hypothetical protein [Microbacterium pumilum]|uniref:Uncharacterized protein n=1 Tax=Microbacterium pumilum TaxID=344165 RepID=A0ABP5E9X8_9MICO
MDAPSLTPGRSRELADLRRRAYGPDADIQRDPGAVARLHELEDLAREQPTESPALPEPARRPDRGEPAAAVVTPADARNAPDGAGESDPPTPVEPSAVMLAPRRPWWRRPSVWAVAGVSLVVGVVIGAGGLWWISQPDDSAGPDLTLGKSPTGGERGPGFAQNLDYWGIARGSVIAYEPFDTVGVWTARGSDESRCILLSYEGQIFTATCAGRGLDPVYDLTVDDGMPLTYEQPLAVGSVIRFIARKGGIDVWVEAVPTTLNGMLP